MKQYVLSKNGKPIQNIRYSICLTKSSVQSIKMREKILDHNRKNNEENGKNTTQLSRPQAHSRDNRTSQIRKKKKEITQKSGKGCLRQLLNLSIGAPENGALEQKKKQKYIRVIPIRRIINRTAANHFRRAAAAARAFSPSS